jgi:hemin uptake protein HemP
VSEIAPGIVGCPAQEGNASRRIADPCSMCKGMANVRAVRSDDLLQGQRELFILHGGQVYRLLRTRNDKLILQK